VAPDDSNECGTVNARVSSCPTDSRFLPTALCVSASPVAAGLAFLEEPGEQPEGVRLDVGDPGLRLNAETRSCRPHLHDRAARFHLRFFACAAGDGVERGGEAGLAWHLKGRPACWVSAGSGRPQ